MPDNSPKLTIVVPIYNEEEALPGFLEEFLPFIEEQNFCLVLVNDGSRDKTRQILEKVDNERVTICRHKLNRGYGGALKTGILASETQYVITIDADGQHRPEDVVKLFERICEEDAELVIGSRVGQKNASICRGIGKFLIRTLAKTLMRVPVQDLNSGMKIYDTKLAQKALKLCPDTMAFSDTMALVFLNDRRLVFEEPITIRPRAGGTSTIGIKDALQTVRSIIDMVMLFHPFNIFLPTAMVLALAGVAWTIRCYLINTVLSQGAAFLLLSSLITLLLGLIAEQIAEIRRR